MDLLDPRQPSPNAVCTLFCQCTLRSPPHHVAPHSWEQASHLRPARTPLFFILSLFPSANVIQHARQGQELAHCRSSLMAWPVMICRRCTSLLTTTPVSTAKTEFTLSSHGQQMENREDANQAGKGGWGRKLAHSGQCLLCKNAGLNSIPRAYY